MLSRKTIEWAIAGMIYWKIRDYYGGNYEFERIYNEAITKLEAELKLLDEEAQNVEPQDD